MEQEHKEDDIRYLKQKVDSGVDFLTTQMFFDNDIHYNFLYRIREAGITVPVLPGIMPQVISKMCKVSKAPIIAGGLISEKESVMSALSAGAMAVSSTNHEVWKL